MTRKYTVCGAFALLQWCRFPLCLVLFAYLECLTKRNRGKFHPMIFFEKKFAAGSEGPDSLALSGNI
jgi:hypothetical protein